MNECVFIYRTYHIVSQGGLQFYLSDNFRRSLKIQSTSLLSLHQQVPKESSAKNIISPSNDKMKSSKRFMGIKTSITIDGDGMFDFIYPNITEK